MAFRADDWLLGTRGGDGVGRRLRRLDATWRVLPNLSQGEGAQTRMVLGRAGVFVIDVQHGSGRRPRRRGSTGALDVRSFLPRLAQEAHKASGILTQVSGRDVAVWPLLVVIGGLLDIQKAAFDVYVVAEQLLVPWLRSLPGVLDDATVSALYELAADTTTWSDRT